MVSGRSTCTVWEAEAPTQLSSEAVAASMTQVPAVVPKVTVAWLSSDVPTVQLSVEEPAMEMKRHRVARKGGRFGHVGAPRPGRGTAGRR